MGNEDCPSPQLTTKTEQVATICMKQESGTPLYPVAGINESASKFAGYRRERSPSSKEATPEKTMARLAATALSDAIGTRL